MKYFPKDYGLIDQQDEEDLGDQINVGKNYILKSEMGKWVQTFKLSIYVHHD